MHIYKILFCILLLIIGHVFAQEKRDSLKTYKLGEVIITSSKNDVINKASVIDVENSLANHTGTDISRVLGNYAGIFYAPTSKNESKLYIRGFDQGEVSVLIDGVPVYQPYDGLVDFGNLPANCFSKVTISKGMSSVLYGSNSMGGVINLITKESHSPFNAEVNLETGKTNSASAGVEGTYANYYYALNSMYSRSGGYALSDNFNATANENGGLRDNSQFENIGGIIRLGFRNLNGFDASYSLMVISNSKGIPADVYTAKPRYWKFTEWKKNINNLMFRKTFSDKAIVQGNTYYENFYNVLDAFDNAAYSMQTKPFAFHSVYDDYSFGANISSSFALFETGLTNSFLSFRKDVHREQGNFNQPFKKYEASEFSCGIEQNIKLSEYLWLVTGIGYSYLKPIYANGGYLRSSVSSLNYNAGVGFAVSDEIKLHAAVSYKNRFPVLREFYSETTGKDVANPMLKPEFALKTEAGIEYNFNENSKAEVVFFRSDVTDLIKQVNIAGGLRQFQNIGKALLTGVELTGEYNYNGFNFNLNYTYLVAKNKSDNSVFDKLEYRPQHVVSFTTSYSLNFGLFLQADILFTGSEYGVNLDNLAYVSMPDKVIAGVLISQSLFTKFNLYIRANNILDKYYESEYAFPQPGREVIFGVKYSL